jgi:hypothetical protein
MVHYCDHKNPPPVPILSQMIAVNMLMGLHLFMNKPIDVTCRGLCVTYKTGSGLDEWIDTL